jgi:hypothetical protein
LQRHAKVRFIERTGIGLTDELHEKILSGIRGNKYQFVEKQSNRVSLWKVPIEKEGEMKNYIVFYDKMRRSLITVLTMEMWGNGEGREEFDRSTQI